MVTSNKIIYTSNSKPKDYAVTIVIPIYNVEKYVKKSFLSALDQSFESIEFLLVDDCGTDDSMRIVNEVIAESFRREDIVIIKHDTNLGLGATRNTGINNASGTYTFFLDSDDVLATDAIAVLHEAAVSEGVELAVGSYTSVNYVDTEKRWEWILSKQTIHGHEAVSRFYFDSGFYVMSWNKLYKKSFLLDNNIRCIPSANNEDIFFAFQVALNATSVTTVERVTYYYSFRPESIMTRLGEKNFTEFCLTLNHLFAYSDVYRKESIYPVVIYYVYWYKYHIISALQGCLAIPDRNRIKLEQQLNRRLLSIRDVMRLANVKSKHRLKYLLDTMPLFSKSYVKLTRIV